MKHDEAKIRVFYRNRFANCGVWLICTWATVIFLDALIESIEIGRSGIVTGLAAMLLIAFLVPALRYPLNGVVVTLAKVVVRNIMRTHTLSWSDIERFELAKYDPWPLIGVAVLKNGKRVPMTGVQWAPLSRFAKKTVAALNQQLAARQADTSLDATGEESSASAASQAPQGDVTSQFPA